MNDDHQRPVTLYVESINTTPKLPVIERPRSSNLDIELTPQAAKELNTYLTERLEAEEFGTIRVRLSGRLVIH